MKLEEEIKQDKFISEAHKLAVNIFFTHSWLNTYYSKIFHKYNITTQQYNILRILRGQYPNPVTINLLKDRMLDKMSDTSRLVERLRGKELVKRSNCENDRRRAEVVITEKGLEILSELDGIDENSRELFGKITEEEAQTVNVILDKMRG